MCDITAEQQSVSPPRDQSHALCRTVQPLIIITMTQHEKDFPLEKSATVFSETSIFLTLSVSEERSRCFKTPHSHYLTEG